MGPPDHLSPLHSAAISGSAERARLLLQFGADPHALNSDGKRPIDVAASVECIDILAKVAPETASEGDLEALLDRLDYDADPRIPDAARRRVALGVSLQKPTLGHLDLLSRYAFELNLPAVVLLLELGVEVRRSGSTALHALAFQYEGSTAPNNVCLATFTRTLISAQIPLDTRDESGNTPLHEALCGDGTNRTVAIELIRSGAAVNAVNKEGQTPLLLMSSYLYPYDDPELIQALIDAGANPNQKDHAGRSAIEAARSDIERKGDSEQGSAMADSLQILERASARFPQ